MCLSLAKPVQKTNQLEMGLGAYATRFGHLLAQVEP